MPFKVTGKQFVLDILKPNGCMTNCTDKTKEDRKGKIRFCMRKEKLRNLKKDKTMQQTNMKADMLDLIEKEIDEWINVEGSIKDGYTYETKMIEVARKVNHIIASKSMGVVSGNRNKKNFIPVLGK
jgi:hypothetical protein